jgi:membrane-associated phospholipid phosphatase
MGIEVIGGVLIGIVAAVWLLIRFARGRPPRA